MTNLIIEGSKNDASHYINQLFNKNNVSKDRVVFYDEVVKIDQARQIKKIVSYERVKPLIFVFSAGVTYQAQNSLLKTVEESDFGIFIFCSENKGDFLPTIASRCKVVTLVGKVEEDNLKKFIDKQSYHLSDIELIYEACGKDLRKLAPVIRELLLDDSLSIEKRKRSYLCLKRFFRYYPLSVNNNVNDKVVLEYIFT